MIMAFGQFVVGGNFVVGVVVFLVLIAIQFIVINHGAVRISEVTARFTLDAMPGKQMAIDADLNAGLIDEQRGARAARAGSGARPTSTARWTARSASRSATRWRRCSSPASTSSPASIIGVFQHGLDLSTAAQTYTILTVGEGLVTAIPALLVSMSGGLITTRAASESNLGEEVAGQLLARPRPLAVAAGVLTRLALIPGLPKLAVPRRRGAPRRRGLCESQRDDRGARRTPRRRRRRPTPPTARPRSIRSSVEVGYALVSLVDEKQGGTLLIARAIDPQADRHRDRHGRAAGAHRRQPAARAARPTRSSSRASKWRAASSIRIACSRSIPGTADGAARGHRDARAGVRPAGDGGLPTEQRDRASAAGYTVVDPTTALSTHLSETIRTFLPDLLTPPADEGDGRPRRRRRRRSWSRSWCRSSCRSATSSACCGSCCASACRCAISTTILEAIADAAAVTKDPDAHHRRRARGARPRHLPAVSDRPGRAAGHRVLAPALEERLLGVDRADRPGRRARARSRGSAEPRVADRRARSRAAVAQPVLLCTPALRPHLWRLFARVLPHIGVLSHNEVPPHVRVAPVAVLD